MNTNFLQRLWLATRIWLIAVVTNTVLGTLYLTDFAFSLDTGAVVGAGLLWGSLFSFPVMIIITAVMNWCIKAEMNGLQLFWGVFVTGILMTVIMFLIFCCFMGLHTDNLIKVLLGSAVLSGITAVTAHCRPLLKLGSNFKNVQIKTDK
jgi:hypothetical protein